ncbi:MAG TPA: hypothetical protein VGM29_12205 [Polyangiaceae bacterium]|jgi:hypothetical protein
MTSSQSQRSSAPQLALLLSLVVIASACASRKPYFPAAPHVAGNPRVRAELTEVDRREFLRAVIEVEGSAGTSLRRVLLAPTSAEPCREGLRERALVVDGKSIWLRPVDIGGRHLLEVYFPAGGGEDLLHQTPVIDFVLEGEPGETCLRVPLSSDAPALAWRRDFDWSTDWALRAAFPQRPVGSVAAGWSGVLGIGRYWGPVRTRLELGVGINDCRGRCPRTSDGSEGFTTTPLRFELDGYLFQTRGVAIAAGLGYQQQWAARRNPDGSGRSEVNRGPHGALRFDFTALAPPGFPEGPRQGAVGLEFSFDRWASTTSADSAWVLGIGLVTSVGF